MKNFFNSLIKFFLENSIIIFQLNIMLSREATIIIKKFHNYFLIILIQWFLSSSYYKNSLINFQLNLSIVLFQSTKVAIKEFAF